MTKYTLFNEKGNFYLIILGLIIHSYNSYKIRIIWIVHIECTRNIGPVRRRVLVTCSQISSWKWSKYLPDARKILKLFRLSIFNWMFKTKSRYC